MRNSTAKRGEKKAEARRSRQGDEEEGRSKGRTGSSEKDARQDAESPTTATVRRAGRRGDGSDSHAEEQLPRVTAIRHWSTPDYTRVAIDLENEIKFGSQRIANPDRIFFDLRDTKLASTLVGKSFDVDDGFLKKIRVAQFQPGRTRVVLEVDDLSDYEAFLLPNPYRLIIDIHGKNDKNRAREAERKTAVRRRADVEAPPKAGSKVAKADAGGRRGRRRLQAAQEKICEAEGRQRLR